MSNELHVGMVGWDISPRFHETFGAFGCNPHVDQLDMALLARCIALEQDGRRLIWFGSDLCGDSVPATDQLRKEVADSIDVPWQQVIWSTSQTHSSGSLPGSNMPGGSSISPRGQDAPFAGTERRRLIGGYVDAANEAMRRLAPAQVWVGRGFCDSISYNTRFPMPNGGVKFSRHHSEGLQSGKFFDPTIGLARFVDRRSGKTIGAIFNFCSHPATMINDRFISPDWVGTARQHVEEAIDGAPAMFVQGFCGDVNCNHMFGTPQQAKESGRRLGEAAARAMATLTPIRCEPFSYEFRNVELPCRPMYTRQELEQALSQRYRFVEELKQDPRAVWFSGINAPEHFSAEQKDAFVQVQVDYLQEARRLLEAGEQVRTSLELPMGLIRLGDMVAVLSAGENFTATGDQIHRRSPFTHTLICGDTNGLFGYIGDDAEIDRGGYETDSYWKMMYIDGFRLALAKGSVGRIIGAAIEMLQQLQPAAST